MTCHLDPDCNCLGPCQQTEMAAQAAMEQRQRAAEVAASSYQQRVGEWTAACFGSEGAAADADRNARFLEEALELAQAGGMTAADAAQLVAYVWGRPAGERAKEAGQVKMVLAALCNTAGIHLALAAEEELRRVWQRLPEIRAKQAAKVPGSPLPGYAEKPRAC